MARWVEETLHKHWRARLKADAVLHESRSAHQHIVIFENGDFGRMMLHRRRRAALDPRRVHLPRDDGALPRSLSLEAPERVLIVGGGDGGVLREVLKHPSVRRVDLCEIDQSVIDLCLALLPRHLPGCLR